MFFTQLPDMPSDMNDEQVIASNEWLQSNVATEIWTTAVVSAKYGLSGARLTQLHKAHQIPGHIKLGATHLYIARYAQAWFDSYKSRDKRKKVKVEVKKPKLKKGEYIYTLWGQDYITTEDPDIVFHNVRQWVMSRWPDYYTYTEKGYEPIGEKINQHPEDLREEMRHVSESFKQAKKVYKNDL